MKLMVITGMIVGSIAGGYLPLLWGGSVLSVASILTGAVGAFAGIYFGYKLAQNWGLE